MLPDIVLLIVGLALVAKGGDFFVNRPSCVHLQLRRSVRTLSVITVLLLLAVTPSAEQDDIDDFMEKVLDRREENLITLQDYILEELETFELVGPGRVTQQSFRREFSWYVRDGYLIRSPVRVDGVEIDEVSRRKAEDKWLRQEQSRRVRRQRQKRPFSRRTVYDDVTKSIERLWGRKVAEALARDIAEVAGLWGDDMAAIVANGDQILADLGGVTTVGFARTVERTRDGFVMLENERLAVDEVSILLGAIIPELAVRAKATSDADHAAFLELLKLAVEFELPVHGIDPALEQAWSAATAAGKMTRARALNDFRSTLSAMTPPASDRMTGAAASDRVQVGLQPRFVSEAYFFDFEIVKFTFDFEPGNYYLVGREVLAERDVLRIEYYQEQLFSDASDGTEQVDPDDEIEAGFDKTSLVTLWIDPSEYQIVKFTFDNVGFEFLPLRWVVRLDDLKASMTMGQPFEGVWLPEQVELTGKVTTALGTYGVTHARSFSDYRQAETGARIRSYVTPQD